MWPDDPGSYPWEEGYTPCTGTPVREGRTRPAIDQSR
nr:hypothetical protein [Gordonia sp. McavH-238-E]